MQKTEAIRQALERKPTEGIFYNPKNYEEVGIFEHDSEPQGWLIWIDCGKIQEHCQQAKAFSMSALIYAIDEGHYC